MKSVQFPDQDLILSPPADWNDDEMGGECVGLPIMRRNHECISCWVFSSWRERLAVLFGRPIWLHVVSGSTQPPVMLSVGDEPRR